MVRNGLFARMSREDLEGVEGESGVPAEGEMIVEEVVEGDTAADEVNEVVAELQEDQASMEDAMEVGDELQESIDENEELLETPEAVDETAVVVAQEHLKTCMRVLGVDTAEVMVPSRESAKESPVTAMRLSVESAKEWLARIWESIKAIFAKMVNGMKKLWVKLVMVANRSEKSAAALKAKLTEYDDKDAKFDEGAAKSAVNLVGIIAFANGNTISGTNAAPVLGEVLKSASDVKTYKATLDAMKAILEAKDGAAVDAAVKGIDGDKYSKALAVHVIAKHADIGMTHATVTRMSGTSCKFFGITDKDGIKTKTYSFAMSADDKKAVSVECANKATVSKLLDSVVAAAKQTKAVYDSGIKFVDDSEKVMKTHMSFMENVSDNASKTEAIKLLNATRSLGVATLLDTTLGQIALTKSVLAYCNLCVKSYTSTKK
jgi:hypothetical protein